jgi:hypothetical protein
MRWIDVLEATAARRGIRELVLRASVYRARLGEPGARSTSFARSQHRSTIRDSTSCSSRWSSAPSRAEIATGQDRTTGLRGRPRTCGGRLGRAGAA